MNREQNSGEDFWGGQSDWTSEQDRPTTRHERFDAAAHWAGRADSNAQRPVARLRRSFSKLLGAGNDATREHGIIRPDAAAPTPALGISADMFDDLDDSDVAYDDAPVHDVADHDTAGWTASAVGQGPDEEPGDWDAEFAPAPIDARRAASIDPLLVRIGAVAVVGALVVPLLLNAAGDDADGLLGTAAATESVASTITLLAPTTVVAPS